MAYEKLAYSGSGSGPSRLLNYIFNDGVKRKINVMTSTKLNDDINKKMTENITYSSITWIYISCNLTTTSFNTTSS